MLDEYIKGIRVMVKDTITDDDGREGIVDLESGMSDMVWVILDGDSDSKIFYKTELDILEDL